MSALATELGLYLLAGSVLEAAGCDGRAYNTSVLIGPGTGIVAKYRKIHLFDVDIEGEAPIRESDHRRPGDAVVVADTPLCPMGLSVCYDLRFPELYRRLAAAGARVIFVPSVFTVPTGRAHWETLLRARAIENQVYIIAPDQTGRHPASMDAYGHSMIVDPWGKVIAEAGTEPRSGAGLRRPRLPGGRAPQTPRAGAPQGFPGIFQRHSFRLLKSSRFSQKNDYTPRGPRTFWGARVLNGYGSRKGLSSLTLTEARVLENCSRRPLAGQPRERKGGRRTKRRPGLPWTQMKETPCIH